MTSDTDPHYQSLSSPPSCFCIGLGLAHIHRPGSHRLSPGLIMGMAGTRLHGATWPNSHTHEEPLISTLGISSNEAIFPVAIGNSGLAFL